MLCSSRAVVKSRRQVLPSAILHWKERAKKILVLCKILSSQGLTPQCRLLVVGEDKPPNLFTYELGGEGCCLAERTLSPSPVFSVPALPLIQFVMSTLQVEMKLIILEHYSQASEWAAKYIRNRIIQFNPGPDKYFTLGLPTGMLWERGGGG